MLTFLSEVGFQDFNAKSKVRHVYIIHSVIDVPCSRVGSPHCIMLVSVGTLISPSKTWS